MTKQVYLHRRGIAMLVSIVVEGQLRLLQAVLYKVEVYVLKEHFVSKDRWRLKYVQMEVTNQMKDKQSVYPAQRDSFVKVIGQMRRRIAQLAITVLQKQ